MHYYCLQRTSSKHKSKRYGRKEGVEIKQYSVIYQALEDVEAAMKEC